ncbi:hypothetical protein PTKIN_Ptkin16aG0486800 [Pterospermum kingtungense]
MLHCSLFHSYIFFAFLRSNCWFNQSVALFLGLTMTATLWGNFTLFIDDAFIGTSTKPILILAGIIVSEFHGKTIIAKSSASKLYLDLDIPIVAELKHWAPFTRVAHIDDMDCTQGWYYSACKICLKRMLEAGRTYFFKKHSENKPYL